MFKSVLTATPKKQKRSETQFQTFDCQHSKSGNLWFFPQANVQVLQVDKGVNYELYEALCV